MTNRRRTGLAALRAVVGVIQLLGLLALKFLIDFGGGEPAHFVTHVFDVGPGQILRRPLLSILFAAD